MQDFLIEAAESMVAKGDKEASCGMASAVQCYRAAARKYRQAAERFPNRKAEFEALAEECEYTANNFTPTPFNAPNRTAPTNNGCQKAKDEVHQHLTVPST